MKILWHGHSFFEIKGKTKEGKEVTLVFDPFSEEIGLKPKKVFADILLISHPHFDHANKKIVEGEPFIIEMPGEYEKEGVFIKGIESFHDKKEGKERGLNTIYVITLEDISFCHFGDFGEGEKLRPEILEKVYGVDILALPVGGVYTISGKEAAKIVRQVEPKIAIPMHYKIENLNINISDEKEFLKALGEENPERVKTLKIKKSDLEKIEGTKVVLMELS